MSPASIKESNADLLAFSSTLKTLGSSNSNPSSLYSSVLLSWMSTETHPLKVCLWDISRDVSHKCTWLGCHWGQGACFPMPDVFCWLSSSFTIGMRSRCLPCWRRYWACALYTMLAATLVPGTLSNCLKRQICLACYRSWSWTKLLKYLMNGHSVGLW